MNGRSTRLLIGLVCVAMLAAAWLWPKAMPDALPPATGHFTSQAGIVYGADLSGRFDTRLAHIMAHTRPDPDKPRHSMFLARTSDDVVHLLDEAWKKRGPPERQGGTKGRDIYDVPLGRPVGREGETRIRLVMERDSPHIVTAYPVR